MATIVAVDVGGRQVHLRVFTPKNPQGQRKPAVVMVCGLLWLGGGVLGAIGVAFNDAFGRTFARFGVPCVQVHTPLKHVAHTSLLDIVILGTTLLTWFAPLRLFLIAADILLMPTSLLDVLPALLLLLATGGSFLWGPLAMLALPLVHACIRASQFARGVIPNEDFRPHQEEIAAAVKWTTDNTSSLGSNGKLVLCGYSSGGHCAALYGGSPDSPKFEAVVLISGLYTVRTHAFEGWERRLLSPLLGRVYGDILGVRSDSARDAESPEVALKRKLNGQDWYILQAKSELMGLPLQRVLFDTKPFCAALAAKGATVHRVVCGLNHWLLICNVADFLEPFCASL